jgi:hypothetical protein
MKKIPVFIAFFLSLSGAAWAVDADAPVDEKVVTERIVHEITMQEAVFKKIAAESQKTPEQDLSQLLKESNDKETPDVDDAAPRDYDADVKKLFDDLY